MSALDTSLVPIEAAPALLPGRISGKRIPISTIHRWATHGCRGVKLDSVMIGHRRYTKPEALAEFLDKINGGAVSNA